MSEALHCYRCGASLAALSLPLSRRDQCPSCAAFLHVCRMCRHYDPQVPRQCREDDAEEVTDKETANFCDWFVPAPGAFDAGRSSARAAAERRLEALFDGSEEPDGGRDPTLGDPEDLFR